MNKFWKKKELHILNIMKEKGYSVELIENFDKDGNELPQVYYVGKYAKSKPDIDVFSDENKKVVIFRVEVKGRKRLPEINGRKVIPIKESQFEHYVELQFLSEVETKIIFVIGIDDTSGYEYFWSTIDEMKKMKKYRSKWMDTRDAKEYYYCFYNPNKFNYGLDGFC